MALNLTGIDVHPAAEGVESAVGYAADVARPLVGARIVALQLAAILTVAGLAVVPAPAAAVGGSAAW